jgi:hypothetical protein
MIVGLVLAAGMVAALPLRDRIALANALIVGRSEADLGTWTCGVCGEENRPERVLFSRENKKDVRLTLAEYPDMFVLSFRHTQTLLNILQDIAYVHMVHDENTPEGCKVQGVMDSMWNSVRSEILAKLAQAHASAPQKYLLITGVSLGGALSGLSYIDIQKSGIFSQIEVVTFGAPRIGNREWAANFDQLTSKKSIRYLIKNDPIPKLPKCLTSLCHYTQTGIKMTCDKGAEKCTQDGKGWDLGQLGQDLLEGGQMLLEGEQVGSIIDHIKNYPKIYNYSVQLA